MTDLKKENLVEEIMDNYYGKEKYRYKFRTSEDMIRDLLNKALLIQKQEFEKWINNLKVRLILTLNTNSKCNCTNMTDKYGNIAEIIINDEIRKLKEIK